MRTDEARLGNHVARLAEIEAALDGVGFAFEREQPLDAAAVDPDVLRARAARLGALAKCCVRAATASRNTHEVVELTWAAEELYAEAEELEALADQTQSRL